MCKRGDVLQRLPVFFYTYLLFCMKFESYRVVKIRLLLEGLPVEWGEEEKGGKRRVKSEVLEKGRI